MLIKGSRYRKLVVVIILLIAVLIVAGCLPQRRPVQPDRTPNETKEFNEPPREDDTDNIDRMGGGNNRSQRLDRVVERIRYVKSSSVIVTGNTAIIGINVSPEIENKQTSQVKKEVEKRVRESDRSIDTVAVTSDPDLVTRIERIADQIARGRPVSAFTTEITEILRRITPVE